MYVSPSRKLTESLSREDRKKIYDTMGSNDIADVVLTVLRILRKSGNMPHVQKKLKSEEHSNDLRLQGNEHFEKKSYMHAFYLYNEALLYAPKNSMPLKLAYSNRSAVLFALHKYQECINDVDKCLSYNCSEDLVAKLTRRKADASKFLADCNPKPKLTAQGFFNLDSDHGQIPSSSSYIETTHEGFKSKVLASSDITVGTVLAFQSPFVSISEKTRYRTCCHFCQKFSLNLMACEGCTSAYFCSEKCRDLCSAEYHKIECHIIDLLNFQFDLLETLMFKAVLKLVLTGTWDELIQCSLTLSLGVDNSQKNTDNTIYDINNKFSIFNSKDERPFIFSDIYNKSFTCAILIHHLESIHSFFPLRFQAKQHAICALARIMMYIIIYRKPHIIVPAGHNIIHDQFTFITKFQSYGLYPFFNNIKKSCQPNVITVSINNKLALVAIKPIKSGTHIIMPYGLNAGFETLDLKKDPEAKRYERIALFKLFQLQRDVCSCKVCTGKLNPPAPVLTKTQKQMYLRLSSVSSFKEICEILAILSDVPRSDEFRDTLKLFACQITLYQVIMSGNIFLDDELPPLW